MQKNPKIPSRQSIIKDFRKWTALGSDREFQFQQVVRRWVNCGYFLSELPLLFNVSSAQINRAIEKERLYMIPEKLEAQLTLAGTEDA